MIKNTAIYKSLFICLITILFTCPLFSKDVTISGKIENLSPSALKAGNINVYVNNIVLGEQIDYASAIDANGFFEISFPLLNSQDILFDFGVQRLTLFVAPADRITLNINAARLPDYQQAFQFSGDHAGINQILLNYVPVYYDFWKKYGDPEDSTGTLLPEPYQDFLYQREKEFEKMLQRFIAENKIKNETFEKWAAYQIKYDCADNLLEYLAENEDVGPGYVDFLANYPLDNIDARLATRYGDYLSNYYHQVIKEQVIKKYGFKDDRVFYPRLIDGILSVTTGYAKDILLTNLALGILDGGGYTLFPEFKVIFDKNINCIDCKAAIQKMYNFIHQEGYQIQGKDGLTLYEDIKTDSILSFIKQKYPGQVIYIDLWATWCGNCIYKMRVGHALQQKVKDKPVAIVYLCARSPRNLWKQRLEKSNFTGEHYYLNDTQYAILKAGYAMRGFPHYLLIDKNGTVYNNAEEISRDYGETVNPGLLERIDGLL